VALQLRFGDCVIDTEARQVLRQGKEVVLSPKAYRLLMLLVDARPKAVAKETLYQALWPETFVVDANLPNLIGEIRGGLGDSAHGARFIRTLHGFGYAFSADVDVASTDEIEPEVVAYLIKPDGQALPLRGAACVVGRGSDVQVRLDLPGVSRHHARLTVADGFALVEDLQSKNGTFVRGERVGEPRTAMNGDEIGFGSVRVTFRVASPTLSTETSQ
jgi:DNA-binding winged helix-turn-helix (wHTH) protein